MGPTPALKVLPGATAPRILIVDDQPDNRELLVRLLVPIGFVVREVDDGLEAVETAQEWRPDAVLMDVQMPRLDGFAATRMIKKSTWGLQTAVIVISGHVGPTSAAEALAAGAVAFIAKPFVGSEVLAALGSALGLTNLG